MITKWDFQLHFQYYTLGDVLRRILFLMHGQLTPPHPSRPLLAPNAGPHVSTPHTLICHSCLLLAGRLEPDLDVTLYSLHIPQPFFTYTIHQYGTAEHGVFTVSGFIHTTEVLVLNPCSDCILLYGAVII